MKHSIFILFLFVGFTTSSLAQTTVNQQSVFLDSVLAGSPRDSYSLIHQLEIYDTQIENKDYIIAKLKSEIDQRDKDVYNHQKYYERLSTQLEYEKKKYIELILQADKIKNSMYNNFDILSFDNLYKSFRQFLFIKYLSDYRSKKIKRIKDLKSEIANVMISLENEQQKRNQLALQLGVERSFIEKYSKSRLGVIQEFEKQLAAKSDVERPVSANIYRPDSVSLTVATDNNEIEQDAFLFEVQKGYLEWPVKNAVLISSFGEKKHPVYDKITIRNDGINFLVPSFSVVKVVFDGVVSKIVNLPTNQFAIIVRHGKYFTVYSGLDHIKVSAGDNVQKNQEIGSYEDVNGKLILNFQIWSGTDKLNPKLWLKQNSKK